MPTKRKKLEKQKDFQKKRLKIGKPLGSQIQNQTSTSFKSKSIHVPSQNLHSALSSGAGKSASDLLQSLQTTRNQSVHDLLCKLNHTNTSARLGALEGLVEIMDTCGDSVSLILSRLAVDPLKLLFDPEQSVRKMVMKSYFSKLYSLITNEQDIMPHFPVTVVYLCSAMSHITVQIRSDSCKFLQLLIRSYPGLTVKYGTEKVVPNMIQLLVSDRSSTTAESRLNLLQNLFMFLHNCLSQQESNNNSISSGPGHHVYIEEDKRIDTLSLLVKEDISRLFIPNPQQIQDSLDDGNQTLTRIIMEVMAKVVPVLMDTWVDMYDQVFMATSISQNTTVPFQTLKTILMLIKLLINYLNGYTSDGNIQKMVKVCSESFDRIVGSNFPLGKGLLKSNTYNTVYFDINILVAAVLSLFDNNDESGEKVVAFVSGEVLVAEVMEKLNSEQVEYLLDAIDKSTEFTLEIMKLGLNSRVKAEPRVKVYRFVKQCLWRDLINTGVNNISSDPVAIKWILSLPRLMWEIKDIDSKDSWEITWDILVFLSLALRRDVLKQHTAILLKLMDPLKTLAQQWSPYIQEKYTSIIEIIQ